MPSQPDLGTKLILFSLGCVALWIYLAARDVSQLERQLVIERRRRREAEELADTRSRQMDQALEKIHEQRKDLDDDDGDE